MHNWSTDTRELKKHKKDFSIWRLEQMINFGTDGKKIKTGELRKYWKNMRIDPEKKRFLKFLLWGRKFLTKNR